MQCYIYAENAVILLTEISSRIIKFYLFPFLISCGTDFAPPIKLVNIPFDSILFENLPPPLFQFGHSAFQTFLAF